MRQFKILGVALASALLVAACGGGGDGNQTPAISYTAVVSFGDSLTDAGTYGPGLINAGRLTNTSGGGMFTVNGIAGSVGSNPVPSHSWAQLISAAAVGKVNCAARIGGFGTAITVVPGCTNYGQGGSRITDPAGTNNAVGVGNITGPLTEPVVTQIAHYISDGGNFSDKQLFTVLAGANEIFALTAQLKTDATAVGSTAFAQSLIGQLVAGAPPANQAAAQGAIGLAVQTEAGAANSTPTTIVTAAVTAAATHAGMNAYTNTAVANAAAIGAAAGVAGATAGNTYAATTGANIAVTGMATAATTLAGYVKDMVTQGARHVVVVNLPDVSQTPFATSTITVSSGVTDNSQQQLVYAMTTTFNQALAAALGATHGVPTNGVLLVDAFSENQRQIANPAHYALTNVKDVACNPALTPVNLADETTASSLVCTANTLVTTAAGNAVTQDQALHFLYADSVHPTPYGHKLLAQYVTKAMVIASWL
jgi:outer membrane lipase/esterase